MWSHGIKREQKTLNIQIAAKFNSVCCVGTKFTKNERKCVKSRSLLFDATFFVFVNFEVVGKHISLYA